MVEGGGGGAGGPQKMAPGCTTQADPSPPAGRLCGQPSVGLEMMMGCFEGSLLQLILTGLNLSAGEI